MRRKHIFMTAAIMTAACLFGACGETENTGTFPTQTDEVRQEESTGNGEKEEKKMESETAETTDITGQTAQGVTIDYNIESYESVQNFSHDLFAQCIQNENPVLSPVSAYLALTMAGCGADGTTKEEFYSVLGNDMMALSDDMMNTLPAKGDLLNLSIADSAWIDDEMIVDDTWVGTVSSLMDAEVFQTDLSTEKTMREINQWIDDRTNGLIDQMLEKPLDEAARLALFNTIYFKGKWEIPFKAFDTRKEDFYTDREQSAAKQVDMMNLYLTDLDYVANDFAEGVILPYQKNDDQEGSDTLAFIALKPTGGSDVREMYDKLTDEVVTDILVNRKTELVNLKLPKFEITFDMELNEVLSGMGLSECFDMEKANFNQMGKTQSGDNLYISLVRQKAKIIVDEEGTEAAAVTEAIMACGAAMEPQEPKEVYFNEPFVYMIMDMDKEIPLFVGILDNPDL